jgi:hypothetical protein
VFLNAAGAFSTSPTGEAPATLEGRGDALFRAAELVDDAAVSPFRELAPALREQAFEQLLGTLNQVPADAPAPAGLTAAQAAQTRASAGSVLLDLLNTAPAAQQPRMLAAYEALIVKETDPRLRETLIFHLSNAPAARTPEGKAVSDRLLGALAPTKPPYDKWFANGKNTVNLSWTVGQGEFLKGFTAQLERNGFKQVGTPALGVSTYEATLRQPGVGDTTFRITVREGGTEILRPMDDPNVQIVGYDGHSNWGRNMTASVKNGPQSADGADGKLLFYNLCVGKGVLDKVKEKYGNAQVVTTYAASNFYTDAAGQMTRGEGSQALIALVRGIAARSDWRALHQAMNAAADIGSGRTWDNYITPISTQVREQVLDRDNDGQADYLDRHFNYSTFAVAEDTAREFQPVKQDRPAGVLDGTKVLVSAGMLNTLSEFSGILDRANPDSRVLAGGWFEPKLGEKDVVRFSEVKLPNGKSGYAMQISSRYAHMSEEALRAISVFEFNRFLGDKGALRLQPLEVKLGGLLAFAQSLSVDEGYRDRELWSAFLARYNLPPDLALSTVSQALGAHQGHAYAGDLASVKALQAALTPAQLEALKQPGAGAPLSLVG